MMLPRRLALAAAFARSWLSFRVGGTPRPLSASFCLTHRCNLRCLYCNSPFLEVPELALPEVERVLDRLVEAGVQRVGLTGGEPLLRDDFAAIVHSARRRGLTVMVNSNLTLYGRDPGALRGLDLLMTSLDGGRDAHVANRGRGSHDGVLQAIEAVVRSGTPVVAIAVVTEQNVDQLDALLVEAERGGFRLHLQPRVTGAECARGERSAELSAERERGFWRTVLARKRAGRPVASSTLYLEALSRWERFDVAAVLDEAARCSAGRGFLYVDANGDAYPCIFLKGKVTPVRLLEEPWRLACGRTPCTRCLIGPHLEFNTLYRHPIRGALNAARTYA